jgi:hypothetical protein
VFAPAAPTTTARTTVTISVLPHTNGALVKGVAELAVVQLADGVVHVLLGGKVNQADGITPTLLHHLRNTYRSTLHPTPRQL